MPYHYKKNELNRYISPLGINGEVLGTLSFGTQFLKGHVFTPDTLRKARAFIIYDAPSQPKNGWNILGGNDFVQWYKVFPEGDVVYDGLIAYCKAWGDLGILFESNWFTTNMLADALRVGAIKFDADLFYRETEHERYVPKPKEGKSRKSNRRQKNSGQGKASLPGAKVAPAPKTQPKAEPPAPAAQPGAVPPPVIKADVAAATAAPTASPNGQPKKQATRTFEPEPADLTQYDLPGTPVLDAEGIMAGLKALGHQKVYQPLVQSLMKPIESVLVKVGEEYQLVDLTKLEPKAATQPAKPVRQRKTRQKAQLPK